MAARVQTPGINPDSSSRSSGNSSSSRMGIEDKCKWRARIYEFSDWNLLNFQWSPPSAAAAAAAAAAATAASFHICPSSIPQ